MEYNCQKLGEFVKEQRLNCGLTQAQFAKRLGIKQQKLSRFEQGRAIRKLNKLPKWFDQLMEVCKISTEDLQDKKLESAGIAVVLLANIKILLPLFQSISSPDSIVATINDQDVQFLLEVSEDLCRKNVKMTPELAQILLDPL